MGAPSIQALFFALCVVIAPWAAVSFKPLVKHVQTLQSQAPHYPQFWDFRYGAAFCVVISFARYVLCSTIFLNWAERILPKSLDRLKERTARCAQYQFKLLYDVLICAYGFSILRNQSWMPVELGGYGSVVECWTASESTDEPWNLKLYYHIVFGYHLHSMVFHCFLSEKRNDFVEMLLHHFVTLVLIGYSYMINNLRVGLLIVFLHDVSDIPGYMVRIFVDTKSAFMTLFSYVSLLGLWGYCRLFVFPAVIIRSIIFDTSTFYAQEGRRAPINIELFLIMLSVLVLLHAYWYLLFLKMGMTFLNTGKREDVVGKVGSQTFDPKLCPKPGASQHTKGE